MAKRRNAITGQWSARLIEMQRSCAWRVLSRAAHQCLSRIEIELADHGGNDIDELPVTFDDFEGYGVHRGAICQALAELEALGFIDVTERGVAAHAAENRRPNKFRLLTRPWEKSAAYRPRWERFKSLKEAQAAADMARSVAAKEKSTSTETAPKKVRKPYQKRENASTETALLASVGNRTTIYISGGVGSRPGTGTHPDDSLASPTIALATPDGADTSLPSRWGQRKSDCASAKRPRRAGCLSLVRWRNAGEAVPNTLLTPIVTRRCHPVRAFPPMPRTTSPHR